VVDIRLLFVNPADAARGCPENPNCCERGFAREAILLIAMLFLATAGLATLLEQVWVNFEAHTRIFWEWRKFAHLLASEMKIRLNPRHRGMTGEFMNVYTLADRTVPCQ